MNDKQKSWKCKLCDQMNAHWAATCGRCEMPHMGGPTLGDLLDAHEQAATLVPKLTELEESQMEGRNLCRRIAALEAIIRQMREQKPSGIPVAPSFEEFVVEEWKHLTAAFGMEPGFVLHDWRAVVSANPEAMLKLYQKSRDRQRQLCELAWALVNKAGGKVTLKDRERAPWGHWQLRESHTHEGDLLIEAETFTRPVEPPTP